MHALRRLVPKPLKRRARDVVERARAAREERRHIAGLRERYGDDLELAVSPDDEMHQFIREFWDWPHHVLPMPSPHDAFRAYLASGDVMVRDLEMLLSEQGRDLPEVTSFLDFACGHGRFTRFLVQRLDPSRITVADINAGAVDFQRRTFGVDGFESTERAADLDHDGQYEVVFTASLFSHLHVEVWADWLERLARLTAPGGLLIVSTHGPYIRDHVYGEKARASIEPLEEGFGFLHTNETHGRLDEGYYGSAFVTEDWVRRQIADRDLGQVVAVHAGLLWGVQDVYVVERSFEQG